MIAEAEVTRQKADLRAAVDARRRALTARVREAAAAAVAARIAAVVDAPDGAVVSGYWPLAYEFDPRPAMHRLAARGHRLALPRMRGEGVPLEFHLWAPSDPLIGGRFKVMEPAADATPVIPDALLVPLVVFDRKGRRLGHGKGYYDVTLAALRAARPTRAIGVAFALQEVDAVPAAAHDQRLDVIVTERQVHRCAPTVGRT